METDSLVKPDKIYTVSEVTRMVKQELESAFPLLWVEGEISNFRPSSTGHYYFSLKDKEAMLSAVMFKSKIQSLTFMPADGILVRAKGDISVYPKRGNYQLICESIQKAGAGDILAMLEERKKQIINIIARNAIPEKPEESKIPEKVTKDEEEE